MEAIHGAWAKGKFNYPKPTAAAKAAAKADKAAPTTDTSTPAVSPRGR